jgi:hypothetical protein
LREAGWLWFDSGKEFNVTLKILVHLTITWTGMGGWMRNEQNEGSTVTAWGGALEMSSPLVETVSIHVCVNFSDG